MDKHLHIVSFDNPFPPDYGGVMDVYYKIRALAEEGIKIHLHCFTREDRKESGDLKEYCCEIKTYPRLTPFFSLPVLKPYIVLSRRNKDLLNNLLIDKYPVLFEGLHTCYYLDHKNLRHKKQYVRTHNIEHDYYDGLMTAEKSFWKKLYFKLESNRLRAFESVLQRAEKIFSISEKDTQYFNEAFFDPEVVYIPAFYEDKQVLSLAGRGNYVLYHGSLHIAENHMAAMKLIDILSSLKIKLVIAGSRPRKELKLKAARFPQIELVADPTNEQMTHLLQHAQIIALWTEQATGMKLKLTASLYQGRFVLVNQKILTSELASECIVAENEEVFRKRCLEAFQSEFTREQVEKRKNFLMNHFHNQKNAARIIQSIQWD